MSSGRGSYQVENRRRLERQRQAALVRAKAMRAEFVRAAAAAAGLSATTSSESSTTAPRLAALPPDSASTEELAAWTVEAEPALEALTREVAERRSERHAADLAGHLRAVASSGSLASPYQPAPQGTGSSDEETDGRAGLPLEDLTARIEEVVARLDGDATEAEQARVAAAAEVVLTDSRLPRETLMTELKSLVQVVGKAAGKRRADRERARGLLTSLDGIVGPEADDVRDLLERVTAGETRLVGVDEARVAAVRARAIAEEDQRYVAEHLAKVLADLGYDVEPPFVSDLAAGVPGYAFVAGSPDHAAEIQLAEGSYQYRLVHVGETAGSARDAEHEVALCKAIGRATAAAHAEGATFTVGDYQPAGSAPVPYVPTAADRRRRSPRVVEQQRERKR